MSEPNYNETVVIPLLQNKYKDLVNQNLVLEANLLIERERNAFLNQQLVLLQSKINTVSKKKKQEESQLDGQTF